MRIDPACSEFIFIEPLGSKLSGPISHPLSFGFGEKPEGRCPVESREWLIIAIKHGNDGIEILQ